MAWSRRVRLRDDVRTVADNRAWARAKKHDGRHAFRGLSGVQPATNSTGRSIQQHRPGSESWRCIQTNGSYQNYFTSSFVATRGGGPYTADKLPTGSHVFWVKTSCGADRVVFNVL